MSAPVRVSLLNRIIITFLVVGFATFCFRAAPIFPLRWLKELAVDRSTTAPSPKTLEELHRGRFPEHVVDPEGSLEFFRRIVLDMTDQWSRELGLDLDIVVYSVEDQSVARTAEQIFAIREVGQDDRTGGLLIYVNPARNEARIEVSYSLAGSLPDALLGRIVRDQLDPYASYDAIGMAVMDVIAILERQLYIQAIRGRLDIDDHFRNRDVYRTRQRFYSGGGGAEIRLSDIPTDVDFKARVPDPKRSRYAPSNDPLESAEAVLRAHREFVGDPTLDLLTPGTQLLNSYYPFAPFEKVERLHAREASRPLRAIQRGDRAVVLSNSPAFGFTPLLFHRIDGLWRYDEVEKWKNLFTTSRGGIVQRSENPYSFGLDEAYGSGEIRDIAPWDLGGRDLHEIVAQFGTRRDAFGRFLYADLLFRNVWSTVLAFRAYQEATVIAPDAPLFWETLGDRAVYVGAVDLGIHAYRELGPEGRQKLANAYSHIGDFKEVERVASEILEDDPYRLAALRSLQTALRKQERWRDRKQIDKRIETLENGETRAYRPVVLTFSPERPPLEPMLDGRGADAPVFYDASKFSTTITNTSGRSVRIVEIECERKGTDGVSSIGDVTDWWPWQSDQRTLEPGESVTLTRTWGFKSETQHSYVAHVFRYCWKDLSGGDRQCKVDRVDQLPL